MVDSAIDDRSKQCVPKCPTTNVKEEPALTYGDGQNRVLKKV